MIPVFIGITIVSFSIVHLAPGSPIDLMLSPETDPAERQRVEELFGLNDPIHVQYGRWVSQILQGNFGTSFRTGDDVLAMLGRRLPNTIQLNIAALIVSLAVAVPIGVFSAVRQYSVADYIATFFSFLWCCYA